MIRRWEQGRAEIDQLLQTQQLTRVTASRELADQYLAQAHAHLTLASHGTTTDPAGAFTLAYDAARLALAAALISQGLRARGKGAHAVLLEAVLAQTEPPRQTDIREFDWMRRLRNNTQYPDIDKPTASTDDVNQAIPAARTIFEQVTQLLDVMPPY